MTEFGPSFFETIEGSQKLQRRRKSAAGRRSLDKADTPSAEHHIRWQWRVVPLVCVGGLLLLSLMGRLWQLQVIQGDQGKQASRNNSLAIELIPAARGIIYDRNGVVLARNESAFRVAVTYARLPKEEESLRGLVDLLAHRLSMTSEAIVERFEQAGATPFVPVSLKSHIDRDTEIGLLSVIQDLPGISIEQDMRRQYPYKEALSHILGYTGSISEDELADPLMSDYYAGQDIGKAGLEKVYEQALHGIVGKKFSQVNAQGLPQQATNEQPSVAGRNLTLSIDADLQRYVYEELSRSMAKYGTKGASIVLQNPSTGEILALVSLPTYDNNLFARGISTKDYQSLMGRADNPLFNRAIAGTYPPGSTIKPLIGGAAVEEGVITPNSLVYSPNVISIGGSDFADWTYWLGRAGPGNINVITAIAQSTDTFFYKVSGGFERQRGMGIQALYKYYTEAGFGSLTGIDLPGEARGVVPNPAWKKSQFPEEPSWYLGNTYQLSIGQSYLLSTPLQVNVMTSALANNGILVKPRLATVIEETSDGKKQITPLEVTNKQVIAQAGLKVGQQGMREGVKNGIIFPLRNNSLEVAAKTGTAEYGVRGDKTGYGTHAWITGYAPYSSPKLSFTIMLENGATSNNTAEMADVILKWIEKNKPELVR